MSVWQYIYYLQFICIHVYTNYDGNGSSFGNILVETSIEDNSFDVELPSLSVIHIVVSNDVNAFDDIEIFDHNIVPTKPTFEEVVLSSNEIKTSENGFYI